MHAFNNNVEGGDRKHSAQAIALSYGTGNANTDFSVRWINIISVSHFIIFYHFL